jgi:hypothetical protein
MSGFYKKETGINLFSKNNQYKVSNSKLAVTAISIFKPHIYAKINFFNLNHSWYNYLWSVGAKPHNF